MDRETLISYANAFVSFLLDTEISKNIDKIILFGSVARGDFDEESDIDIFIDTLKDIGGGVERILNLFMESETYNKWKLRGIKNEISIKTGKLEEWALRRDVISNGIILYGKYNELPEDVKYYLMIKVRFEKMERNTKIKLWRKLYGYRQKIGQKKYETTGLVNELGGKKLERSLLLIPMEKKNEIIKFLNKNKLSYTVNEIWSDNL